MGMIGFGIGGWELTALASVAPALARSSRPSRITTFTRQLQRISPSHQSHSQKFHVSNTHIYHTHTPNSPADRPPPAPPNAAVVTDASTHLGGGPSLSATGDDVQHGAQGDAIPQTGFQESQPLNAHERRGLLVLGGIVLGGLTLSTLTKPRSKAAAKEVVSKH